MASTTPSGDVNIAGGTTNLPVASTIDGANDYIPIYTASATATQAITRNVYLGLASAPIGTSDSQTMTNKTLTNPTISGPTLSGTIGGTYVIGGTPTFPASVVTLTGSQTLTNKTLTSPTINSPTITNATISADAITGYTTGNTGTIYGVSVTTGQIATTSSVLPAALATGIQTAKFSNQYKFSVYRNAAWTDGSSTTVLITFDTNTPAPTAFDTGSNYSTSTGKFTAPVAGFYWFHAMSQRSLGAGQVALTYLFKNGSLALTGTQLDNGASTVAVATGVSGLMQLAANDYIQIYSYGSGGAGNTGASATYFQGFLVSAT